MAAKFFKQSLALVLAHEGGYSNHPKDPGGPTYKGVTQNVYDAYRRLRGATLQSVKYATSDELADIYKKQYWQLVRGDDLPAGLDYAVFDFAVNSGVNRAIRYLQVLLDVNPDAILGEITLAALVSRARIDEESLIVHYCANRMKFLKSLKTFPTFGKGWTRRVLGYVDGYQDNDSGVLDYAINMARGDEAYVAPRQLEVSAKAIDDTNFYPITTNAEYLEIVAQNDLLAMKIALDRIK